ncbi:MAG: hypothetical protein AVDCRST_MAG27-580, partial [uncultured Craurococcus sp.]
GRHDAGHYPHRLPARAADPGGASLPLALARPGRAVLPAAGRRARAAAGTSGLAAGGHPHRGAGAGAGQGGVAGNRPLDDPPAAGDAGGDAAGAHPCIAQAAEPAADAGVGDACLCAAAPGALCRLPGFHAAAHRLRDRAALLPDDRLRGAARAGGARLDLDGWVDAPARAALEAAARADLPDRGARRLPLLPAVEVAALGGGSGGRVARLAGALAAAAGGGAAASDRPVAAGPGHRAGGGRAGICLVRAGNQPAGRPHPRRQSRCGLRAAAGGLGGGCRRAAAAARASALDQGTSEPGSGPV